MKNKLLPSFKKRSGSRLSPGTIAFIYAVVGGLWILASDRIVELASGNPDTITHLQTYKGWFYVLLTALMLYGLIRRYGNRLLSSNRRTSEVLESISDGFFALDEDLVVTYFNTAAEKLLGRDKSDVLGRGLFDAFPEAKGSVFEEQYRRALREKRSLAFETFFGIEPYVNWYDVRVYPLDKGIAVYFQVTTERKQAENALRESEERFRSLSGASLEAIMIHDQGVILDANAAFARLFGYEQPADLIGKNGIELLLTPETRARIYQRLQRREEGLLEMTGLRKDGATFVAETDSRQIKYRGSDARIVSCRDITERKRAEAAISESRERFKNLVEASSDWVWEVDEHGVYAYASPKVKDILGYEPAEVLGKTPFDLMPSEEAERVSAIFKEIAASQKPFSLLENVNLHKNGNRVILETSGVPFFDSTGHLKGYRGIDRDITERKHAEETIRYQAYHDFLTGLPNRPLFADLLEHEILEMDRIGKRLAVLFLDVDQFKNVNDSFGHAAGDTLIQHIAARLKNSCRQFDTIARIGGDEFTLLLPLIHRPEDASRIADKVMQTFSKPFIIDHHELHLTVSIGISLYPEDGQDAGSLLKNADIALHFAKDQGRDNYQFYNSSISHRTLERIIFENRLRQAVERGEMVVHYQPQRNIKTGKITGAEALVRWNHPDLGTLGPAQFIPLAEETGLIIEIDQWVLDTVCKQLKAWETAGHALPFVTTNLSARQFQQGDLAGIIGEILEKTALRPGNLGIEITETLAMRDTALTSRNLNQLNSMGVKLIIDDFGTGYSSLSYLKKLPIHKLKIDKSFITDVAKDRDDQAITNAIVAMAHILKLKVVAEGVETEGQEELLKSQDCDEMQGFLFSEPVPAGEFEKLLVTVAGNGGLDV